jgi:hypothetical protein
MRASARLASIMKPAVALLLLTAACTDDIDHYPVNPGGGGYVEPAAGTGSGPISGRVCVRGDLLDAGTCSATGAGGLTVDLDGTSVVTADDGTFELPAPTGAPTAFTVSGAGAITTTTPYDPSLTTLPVVDADVWASTMASNSISLPAGTGSILGTVTRGELPAGGVTVTSAPTSAFDPLFDTDTGFGLPSTGARGVFLVPGVTAGMADLTFAPGSTLVSGVPVVNGGVTILDSTILP